MHDIVIRGGTVIDGTGKAAFTGDVAIAGGPLENVAPYIHKLSGTTKDASDE
jgi:N-acyl-D-aspartate/D-glutamate deacylase